MLTPQAHELKDASHYIRGIIEQQDLLILAEAITLLESDHSDHKKIAAEILIECERMKTHSKRLGITGSPGVGKSTFIESVTPNLIAAGSRAAILTIDPSSIDNRGSILGDKTRMNALTRDQRTFVRPSPSRTYLGGTHALTYEAIIMCEAAGIDNIIVETVGVGQSEYAVGDIVDCTVLLLLPGSGDDLQGIKKGITQIADIIVIHKSDGDRLAMAQRIAQDYQTATHITQRGNRPWQTTVCMHSSVNPSFETKVIDHITAFFQNYDSNDIRLKHRKSIKRNIMNSRFEYRLYEELKKSIYANHQIQQKLLSDTDLPFATLETLLRNINLDLKCG